MGNVGVEITRVVWVRFLRVSIIGLKYFTWAKFFTWAFTTKMFHKITAIAITVDKGVHGVDSWMIWDEWICLFLFICIYMFILYVYYMFILLQVQKDLPFSFFHKSLHKKWSFPLRFSYVNVTKSAGNCDINWRKP